MSDHLQIEIDQLMKELLLINLENKIAIELEKHYPQPPPAPA